jgi:hypothetical protein
MLIERRRRNLFYKKLVQAYRLTDCIAEFDEFYLQAFFNYISSNNNPKRPYLNPYEFAFFNKISIEEALRFFMYFTHPEHGILDANLFFDCPSLNCTDEKIYLDNLVDESYLYCDGCNKEYIIESVKPFIKVYFIIKTEFNEPDERFIRKDKNSTYEIIEGLPDILKGESPISTINVNLDVGEEQKSPEVPLSDLISLNEKVSGEPITSVFPTALDILKLKVHGKRRK